MKRLLFALILLLASFSADAANTCMGKQFYPASGDKVMCSASWMGVAACNSVDQVLEFRWSGSSVPPGYQITPWESVDITIRGVEVSKWKGGQTQWGMVGNGYVPDIILHLGRGQEHGRNMFPAGLGMPFPHTGSPLPYFDLHLACTSDGDPLYVWYTLYYTVP